ncbi:ABC transporter permease [Dyella flagellata]|uniref:ABC transporter ATP-binding protein n=1 Tax=Dyella flagellata TaxID=1867833 RepID=A0ABQ5XHH8_9GAMM|nr:ABC transporter permease [Dyella flagellata]GLQ90422.1 ABC transporter ATP-binding protein [Dyella flagellata]
MLSYYFHLAIRSLRHNKVLTGLMVLAIAVGIGASMTTLTVMHLLSGNPLPGKSDVLFYAQVDPNPNGAASRHQEPPDKLDYQSAIDLWSKHNADRQALVVESPVKLSAPDVKRPPSMGMLMSTTADFFTMFDVPFQYGGSWTGEDDARRSRVAVISSELNDRLYGGVNSVGRTLRLRNDDVRIVGVLKPWRPAPQFYDVAGGRFSQGQTADYYAKPEDAFTPFYTGLEVNDGHFEQFNCWDAPKVPGHLMGAGCEWIGLWVELDSKAKVTSYRSFLANYAAQQKALGRISYADNTRLRDLMDWLQFNQVVPSDVRLQAWLALSFLVICLCNTVGLLLVKFLRRSGEIGIRRALGASRRQIFAQCLIEASVIGVFGGAGGWLLTLVGLGLVRRQPVAYADLAHLDVSMFGLTFLLAVLVSAFAGTLPALRASRIAPALQLKTL